jgi:hypothetical protein
VAAELVEVLERELPDIGDLRDMHSLIRRSALGFIEISERRE